MIIELGHFAVTLALLVAILQSILPLWGVARDNTALMQIGSYAAVVQFALILLGFLALMHAHITDDFSVLNVVQHSHTLKPLLYKFAGVWGNHEGSLLLWVLILSGFGAALAWRSKNLSPSQRARVLAIQGMIGVGFLLFILFTSNPFARLFPPPLDGEDLNPLLQDFALALHPPFLYLGYVGFSIAFAFAVAALIEGKVDTVWARAVRPWILIAWIALTIGIGLGSWWAYYELGWGGWWFWDPVENASLLPWLSGTALLHSVIVVATRGALKRWTVLLAIITFSLSLLGTFLVRSGVLTSVHAFAVDPQRGVFILALLVLATGGALALFAMRAEQLRSDVYFNAISREAALVLNNLFLLTACGTVLFGTLYPLLLDALGGGTITVGAPYFNKTFVPLMLPLLMLMVIGPLLPWGKGDLQPVFRKLWLAALLTIAVAALAAYFYGFHSILGLAAIIFGVWLVCGSAMEAWQKFYPRKKIALHIAGRILAHGSLGIAAIGMGGTAFTVEKVLPMGAGDRVTLAGYELRFDGVTPIQGPNYGAYQGSFAIWHGDKFFATLRPEKRYYPVAEQNTTEAGIVANAFGDIFITLGEQLPPQNNDKTERWSVRIAHHPLIPWIWIGALLMGLGGLLSLIDRQRSKA